MTYHIRKKIEDFIGNDLEFDTDDISNIQLTEHSERAFFKAFFGDIMQSELHRYTFINLYTSHSVDASIACVA